MALREVIGQEKAIRIVLGTLERGRIPSAYLFTGDQGIGKKFTALNLAKAVNCLHEGKGLAGQGDACDECRSCKKITEGAHPDVSVIIPEKGEIKIEVIRSITESLSLKSFEGRRKVVIIDDADAMNQSAANAFLKTLEEPPGDSLLVLISANPDLLPETIRSRCSRVRFVPLSDAASVQVIEKVRADRSSPAKTGRAPKPVLGEGSDLWLLVRLSFGRPGYALTSDIIKERELFFHYLRSMLQQGKETWADKDEMEQWFQTALIVLRDMILLKVNEEHPGQDNGSVEACAGEVLYNADQIDLMRSLACRADIARLTEIYDRIVLLLRQLNFHLNKAITWNYTASFMGVFGEQEAA